MNKIDVIEDDKDIMEDVKIVEVKPTKNTSTQTPGTQKDTLVPVRSEIDVLANPKEIIDNAIQVAKILKDVVERSKKKSIIVVNNNEYLMFSAWQTIAQFYGFTAQTEWTKKIEQNGRFMGYEAKSVLVNLRNGQTYPGAEAICLTSETNWGGKPEFTLKSMAQTRACSKTLANKFRWVAVLAGYEGTPGEEISAELFSSHAPRVQDASISEQGATEKQIEYIRKNFIWKKLNVTFFEHAYKPINDLTLTDAKKLLDYLLKEKTPNMQTILDVVGAKKEIPMSNEPDPTDEWSTSKELIGEKK